MSKPKFPNQLFVRLEGDGADQYFMAQETTLGIVNADDKEKVGIYELVKRVRATAPTSCYGRLGMEAGMDECHR